MSRLSPQHHVKDKHPKLTFHTCAFSTTCVLVSVHFQRIGKSMQDTYHQCVKEVFQIGRGKLDLHNVILTSNRGYWEKEIFFQNVLNVRSNIVKTMKRVGKNICCVFLSFFTFLLFLCCWLLFCFFLPFGCCVTCITHNFFHLFFFVILLVTISWIGSLWHSTTQVINFSPKPLRISPKKDIVMCSTSKQGGREKATRKKFSMLSHIAAVPGRPLLFLFRPSTLTSIGTW